MRELNFPGKENTIALWNRKLEGQREGEKCWLCPAGNADYFLAHLDPVFFSFEVCRMQRFTRGKAQSSGTSGVTFGRVCCTAPGAFTATSVVSLTKSHFFSEKNQKTVPWLPGLCDKQVAAGKTQPCIRRLPFPQHPQRF